MAFVRLNRAFFDNAFWKERRTYSQAEAWLDLIQLARYQKHPFVKTTDTGKEIYIHRGEIHASLRYLSAKWIWSVNKVKRFIDKAIEREDIKRRVEERESILTLVNYDIYNPLEDGEKRNTGEHSGEHSGEHTGEHMEKNIKKPTVESVAGNDETPNGTQVNTPSNTLSNTHSNTNNKKKERKKKEVYKEKPKKFIFKTAMLKYGFDETLVDEWLLVRNKKKAVNSELAFKQFITQVEKTNIEKNELLRIVAVEKQWRSFNANWDISSSINKKRKVEVDLQNPNDIWK